MAAAANGCQAAGNVWPTRASQLIFEEQLGHGFFGDVWRCELATPTGNAQIDGKKFAVKMIPLRKIRRHNLTEQMEREIEILRTLRHPRIVKLCFDFRDDNHIYLGMPLADGGCLYTAFKRSGTFNNEQAAQYFYEICDALNYLHTRPEKIIHRDIKPENILLDGEGHAHLADFGWSNMLQDMTMRFTLCGTPDYLAPEMALEEGHNESLDMWMMGVLLYEMLAGTPPFEAGSPKARLGRIKRVDLQLPSEMDGEAQDLITNLCRRNPQERLTAAQAMRHPFVIRYARVARPTEPLEEVAEVRAAAMPSPHELAERQEAELMTILHAKMEIEMRMLQVSDQLDERHKELKAAEARVKELKEREEQQLLEMQELSRQAKALSSRVVQIRSAT